jgi:hypothetical protein
MAVASAVKLKLYNEALALLRETKLATISEAREPRYRLDDAWDAGALDATLEKGQWHFASRAVSLTYSPSITPSFGYRRAFDKPSDMVRLTALCSDEYLNEPLLRYQEVGPYWLCDLDTVYLKYVSNDNAYGNDSTLWPASFREVLEAVLAEKTVRSLTTSQEIRDDVVVTLKKRLEQAVSLGAMAGPTRFAPPGSWVSSRRGRANKYDRGTR